MFSQKENTLYGSFMFADFPEAFAFITRVALLAEKRQHHPTIKITFSKVELWLSTHHAGDTITSKDIALAEEISALIN